MAYITLGIGLLAGFLLGRLLVPINTKTIDRSIIAIVEGMTDHNLTTVEINHKGKLRGFAVFVTGRMAVDYKRELNTLIEGRDRDAHR